MIMPVHSLLDIRTKGFNAAIGINVTINIVCILTYTQLETDIVQRLTNTKTYTELALSMEAIQFS